MDHDFVASRSKWLDFLIPMGFTIAYDSRETDPLTYDEGESWIKLEGKRPKVVIHLLLGDFRKDTPTGGAICADFKSAYNKISQCPIYCCDNIEPEKFWEALQLMRKMGVGWSKSFGRIRQGYGDYWVADPGE